MVNSRGRKTENNYRAGGNRGRKPVQKRGSAGRGSAGGNSYPGPGKRRTSGTGNRRSGDTLPGPFFVTPVVISVVLLSVVAGAFYFVRGSYKGLGNARGIPENDIRAAGYRTEDGLLKYDYAGFTSESGIDVSEYQKVIDWEKVAASGIEFAMIRVGFRGSTDGALIEDARAEENFNGARAAGIGTGAYFYSQAKNTDEAVEEAKFVVRNIRGKGVTYPVAFDMEVSENDRNGKLTVTERTEITDAFCSVIEQNGYTPMVYGNPKWLSRWIDLKYLTSYDVWLAHYTGMTDYRNRYRIWQYSCTGRIDGITTNVDMDIRIVPE